MLNRGQMYGFFCQMGMGYGVLEGYGLSAKIKREPTSSHQKPMGYKGLWVIRRMG